MRRRIVMPLLLAAGLCLTGSAPQQTPEGASSRDIEGPPPATMSAPAGSEAPAATLSPSPPQRAPLPRTMSAYWPMFGFFALSWAGITVYLLRLGAKAGRIAQRVAEVEERP